MSRIVDGAKEASEFARVEMAIREFIKFDAPLNWQMTWTPELNRKLAARITGATVHEKDQP